MVIPAHNEEVRLPRALDRIDAFLKTQPYTAEVVVVENGSVDRTFEVAQEYASRLSYVRPIQVDTRGKGLAVKA
ncbi:MAG: glycosyl transferase, partial [Anaerolineae bacterium UTCFX5]